MISFLFRAMNHDWFPRSYWANTSSNSIVRKLIEKADDSVKGEIERLIDGGAIEKPVHEDITYDEIYNTIDNMWNFMFFTGYFRKIEERMDDNDVRWLTMRLPNREAGKGRSDLFVKPVSRRKEAFVVEFKVAKRPRDLEKMADEAIKQIVDRRYAAELYDEGYEVIGNYGIAFCGKDCLIKFQQ